MNNKEILNKTFEKYNCKGILGEDGSLFKAVLEAMDIVSSSSKISNISNSYERGITKSVPVRSSSNNLFPY